MKQSLKQAIQLIAGASGIRETASIEALVDGLPESMLAPLLSQQLTEARLDLIEDRESAFFDEFQIPGLKFAKSEFDALGRGNRRSIWRTIDSLAKDIKKEANKHASQGASAVSTASSVIGAAMSNAGGGSPLDISGMLGLMKTLGAGNPVIQQGLQYFRDNQHRLQEVQAGVVSHIRAVMKQYGIERETFFKFVIDMLSGLPLVKNYLALIDKEELLNAVFGSNKPKPKEEVEKERVLSTLSKFDL